MQETITKQISVTSDLNNFNSIHLVFGFFYKFKAFVSIIIIVVNFLVILSRTFLLTGQQPRATYIFLGNISLADMLIGIKNLFIFIYQHQLELENEIACSISLSMLIAANIASTFTIALIAIDRYLYILNGLHYHRYITTKHPYYAVLFVWILASLIGLVPIFTWQYPMNGGTCWFTVLVPPKIFLIPVVSGMVPILLVLVLYCIIVKNALNSRNQIKCRPISSPQNYERDLRMFRGREQITSNCADEDLPSRVRSFGLPCCRRKTLEITPYYCENKWKAIKIVVLTTGAYFITWFPYFVTLILYASCNFSMDFEHCEYLAYLLSNPLSLLILSNSLLNPLIYAWWHPGFQVSIKKMYSRVFQNDTVTQPKIQNTFALKKVELDNFENLQRL
ncbi:glucose-dependent insulinotropic receptor-like [Episyrphus balteatus]|uniref:glucose-dependent insulinotropic receptor-like n=1 Tax=Episyrphus balteatus TaxID=286459 RepID=UPI0024850A20|nr:glucose-dependent insulinotropic receptor-like [Episyrphus balteatus]